MASIERRRFLGLGLAATGTSLAFGPGFWRAAFADHASFGDGPYGPLGGRDANGIRLPEGFTSRIVATAGEKVPGDTGYVWHTDPDGGAVFPTGNGGWVYVSNQEERLNLVGGGAGSLIFDRTGEVIDGRRILSGTYTNCAGGPTPWGTWLSCEEHLNGRVWECDPLGEKEAVARPALGSFFHEAVHVDDGVDPQRLYLTEDSSPEGRLYRFTPRWRNNLGDGVLEAAIASEDDGTGRITWVEVNPALAAPQAKLLGAHTYDGAEGIWIDSGLVYFTTKGDNTVWVYDPARSQMEILYRAGDHRDPPLTGVDNIVFNSAGELFVAEDGGNMELVLITPDHVITPFLRIEGQDGSEIAGPAFDPSGTRLYLSSMRGKSGKPSSDGITYEITGPFNTADRGTAQSRPPLRPPLRTPAARRAGGRP